MEFNSDYDYIVKVIQILENRWGTGFFISSSDFDLLYRWWEKRIPLPVVQDTMDKVMRRRKQRNLPVRGFSVFAYQMRRDFSAYMEMAGGLCVPTEPETLLDEILRFMQDFPAALEPLRSFFEEARQRIANHEKVDCEKIDAALLDHFSADEEIEIKVCNFLNNLDKNLRKPGVARRYRLNYLRNFYGIPDFTLQDMEETDG